MRMLTVTVAITTIATASHAETIEDFLQSLQRVSGPRDITVLIGVDRNYASTCARLLSEPAATITRRAYGDYRACIAAEAAKARERAP